MDSYLFEIADENKEVITMCQTAAINNDKKKIDILPSYLKANETINGYLYCETNRKDIKWLKILRLIWSKRWSKARFQSIIYQI